MIFVYVLKTYGDNTFKIYSKLEKCAIWVHVLKYTLQYKINIAMIRMH